MIVKTKDPQSIKNFWLNFGDLISNDDAIASASIDPDGDLTTITATSNGINSNLVTDNDGNTYRAGTLVGLTLSGGSLMTMYSILTRATLGNGEVCDRTFKIMPVSK